MFHVTDCEEEWDDVLENEVRPKHFAQLLRPAWHPTASKVDVEAYPIGMMPPLMQHFLQGYRLISGHKYRPLIYVRAEHAPTPTRTHSPTCHLARR